MNIIRTLIVSTEKMQQQTVGLIELSGTMSLAVIIMLLGGVSATFQNTFTFFGFLVHYFDSSHRELSQDILPSAKG